MEAVEIPHRGGEGGVGVRRLADHERLIAVVHAPAGRAGEDPVLLEQSVLRAREIPPRIGEPVERARQGIHAREVYVPVRTWRPGAIPGQDEAL